MQRGIRWVGLLVLLAFVLPAIGADEKTDKKKPAEEKKAPEKSKYIAFGQPMAATIVSVDDRTVKLVAKVPFRQGGRVAYREQEAEFELAEDVRVRIEWLPPKVDEDGKKVKRTPEELKELKGKDSAAWGYNGSAEVLQPGRNVMIWLSKVRGGEKEDPPIITSLRAFKMAGDDKVDAGAPGFGTGEKKPKEGKEGETEELVPFGQPFVAMYARTENDSTIHLIRRNPVFQNGKVEYKEVPVSMEAADGLKIRVELPPPELDETGKLKKFTKEELKELKGENEKEWGYTGNVDNLQPGRVVKVFLGKPKGADKTDAPVIMALHVGKEPGDLKVDPEELVFIEKKKPAKKDDDEKKDDKKDEKKKKEDEDRPPPYGRPFIATVARVEGLKVHVTVKERVLNGTKVEFRDKNLEYSVFDGVQVRIQEPALTFDDKGGIKKYTPEELKELKGPEGLWGFPTDMEAVQPGRRVKLFLGRFPDDKRDAPVILQILVAKPPKAAE